MYRVFKKKFKSSPGYRSPATNEALRSKSSGAAKKSHHMLGKAIDFRIDGVNLKELRRSQKPERGWCRHYARSNFIHIDTGPVRSW
ncbi:DUF882 domain-containing protein [Vibrio lentus]|nr:DUF882 domain-containing protein [Vibrio lentus]